MPIEIKNQSVLHRLDNMLQHLHDLPTKQAEALYDWQTQDMKRQWPNEISYDGDVHHWTTTEIHPRPMHKHKPTGRGRGRPKGVKTGEGSHLPRVRRATPAGPRPIMRPTLLEEAWDRQRVLLKDVTWD
jgi:hypothetical protein